MHLDVQDLRNFYYRSALGRAAQKAVREQVLDIWPEAKGLTVMRVADPVKEKAEA
mgnify:CR=1 FL=1